MTTSANQWSSPHTPILRWKSDQKLCVGLTPATADIQLAPTKTANAASTLEPRGRYAGACTINTTHSPTTISIIARA